MDILQEAYKKSITYKKIYKTNGLKASINRMKSFGYDYKGIIHTGSFSDVIELENKQKSKTIAAKVVLQDFVSNGELHIWPKLKNEFILPLYGQIEIADAHTRLFFMPLCKTTLYFQLDDAEFLRSKEGFKILVDWLEDIANGLNYLQEKDLCHLNLKLDNVLIENNGFACISDFRFACDAVKPVVRFGLPLAHTPPEASLKGPAEVNGKTFDIWTLGILALEMFTGRTVKASSNVSKGGSFWPVQVYPVLFKMLQEKELKSSMQAVFPASKLTDELMLNLKNFVTACLSLNPENRPSCDELLNFKIFGGKNAKKTKDLWKNFRRPI